MSSGTLIALVCSEADRPRVWGLAAWLMGRASSVVVGWNAATDPVPDYLVVCYSSRTLEDLEVSRAIAAFLDAAPRERLLRVELGEGTEAPDLPPILACQRGSDGLLAPLDPPLLAGSVNPARGAAGIEAAGAAILKVSGADRGQQRRALFLHSSLVALTAAVTVCIGLGLFAGRLGDELDLSRAAHAEAARFADIQLLEIAAPLQASARQNIMIAAGERLLERELPVAATAEDFARRLRLMTWLAEAQDLSGDRSGAARTYAAALALADEANAGAQDAASLLALAELTSSAGVAAYRAGDLAAARAALDTSREHAQALLAMAPDDRESRKRMASASVNSAVMAYESEEPEAALLHLRTAVAAFHALQEEYGEYAGDLANAYAWMADAYRSGGQLAEAASARRIEAEIFSRQLAEDPENNLTAFRYANAAHAEASLRVDVGDLPAASAAIEAAADVLERLAVRDPENVRYLRLRLSVERDRAEIALFENALIRAQLLTDAARRMRMSSDPQGANDGRVVEAATFDILSGQIALAANVHEDAALSAASALAVLSREPDGGRANARLLAVRAYLLQYDAFTALGRPEAARALREAHALVQAAPAAADLRVRDLASRVYWLSGEREQAVALRAELEEAGYARPDFVAFWSRPAVESVVSGMDIERTGDGG